MRLENDYFVKNDTPLLTSGRVTVNMGKSEYATSKKLQKARKIYLTTIFSVLLLIALLFVVWAIGRGEIEISRRFWSELSEGLLEVLLPSEEIPDNELKNPDVPSSEDVPTASVPSDKPQNDISKNESEGLLESLYFFDHSKVPNGEYAIIPADLSCTSRGEEYINNSTGYSPDIASLTSMSLVSKNPLENISNISEPLVLIIHTHGGEAYSPDGAISYADDGSDICRSSDPEKNVISLGKIMADVLNQKGIATVHCEMTHDYPQYKDSYSRAKNTIEKYLEEYPSIKLVIDLHRDAIFNSSEEMIRPVTLVDGEAAAQIMCVVGSDWGDRDHPNWEKNLSLALKLRKLLNDEYTNLSRPVDLRGATYNQELSEYSLLIEIGSCGNTLAEAQKSAKIVALAIANILKNIPL